MEELKKETIEATKDVEVVVDEVVKEELGVIEEKVVLVVVVVLVKVEMEVVVGEEIRDENEGRNIESISAPGRTLSFWL